MNSRLTFLTLLALLTFTTLQAQFSVGIKGGYTSAWEDYGIFQAPEGADISVDGWNASAVAYYRLNNFLSIGMEPGFIERGAACVPGWQPIFNGDTRFDLHYIQAPIFVAGNLPLSQNRIDLIGRVGYGPSFLAAAYIEQIPNGTDEPMTRTKVNLTHDSSDFNRLDHGVHGHFGIGYNLPFSQIFLEANYYHGFLDAEIIHTSLNRNWSINLGWIFEL